MGMLRNAKETASEIRETSRKVGEAAELQTLALVAVTAVSLVALALALLALRKTEER